MECSWASWTTGYLFYYSYYSGSLTFSQRIWPAGNDYSHNQFRQYICRDGIQRCPGAKTRYSTKTFVICFLVKFRRWVAIDIVVYSRGALDGSFLQRTCTSTINHLHLFQFPNRFPHDSTEDYDDESSRFPQFDYC